MKKAPDYCPQCGELLKATSVSCPQCGSDWQTGWSTHASVDWETPDYEEMLESEFSERPKSTPTGTIKAIAAMALALLLGLLLLGVF